VGVHQKIILLEESLYKMCSYNYLGWKIDAWAFVVRMALKDLSRVFWWILYWLQYI